jgi:MFS family permease
VVTSSLFGVTAITLLIVRAHELGLGDGGVGIFFTVSALGALLGGIVAGGGSYEGPRAFVVTAVASIVWVVALVGYGFAESLLLAVPMLLLAGIVGQVEEIAGLTAFQNHLPERVYGRVFSLFLIAGAAGALAGGLLGPALAETVGAGPSLLVLGIPVLVLSGLFALRLGDIRPEILFPTAPVLEPEVVGHGMFGLPAPPAARGSMAVRLMPVPRVYRPG